MHDQWLIAEATESDASRVVSVTIVRDYNVIWPGHVVGRLDWLCRAEHKGNDSLDIGTNETIFRRK